MLDGNAGLGAQPVTSEIERGGRRHLYEQTRRREHRGVPQTYPRTEMRPPTGTPLGNGEGGLRATA